MKNPRHPSKEKNQTFFHPDPSPHPLISTTPSPTLPRPPTSQNQPSNLTKSDLRPLTSDLPKSDLLPPTSDFQKFALQPPLSDLPKVRPPTLPNTPPNH